MWLQSLRPLLTGAAVVNFRLSVALLVFGAIVELMPHPPGSMAWVKGTIFESQGVPIEGIRAEDTVVAATVWIAAVCIVIFWHSWHQRAAEPKRSAYVVALATMLPFLTWALVWLLNREVEPIFLLVAPAALIFFVATLSENARNVQSPVAFSVVAAISTALASYVLHFVLKALLFCCGP